MKKEYCTYLNLPGHPYNSLLDDYEEGMTVEKLKREFSYLKSQIIKILLKIKESERFKKQMDAKVTFDKKNQEKLVQILLQKMLLPNDRFRIDVSIRPVTIPIGNDDVRITTNYSRNLPLFAFSSTLHEAGHALYELGMPKGKFKDTVVSGSPSKGLHESQSMFWMKMIGLNIHFWSYFLPVFKKIFPSQLKSINLDMGYFLINQVKSSLILIESDELTSCLHIIHRIELEMDMLDEKLSVKELPDAWDKKMDELLGITPKTDNEGILQDIHWSIGLIGYFPTYAIGSIYASQLFNQLIKDHPSTMQDLEQGNFKFIIDWLRNHVHKYGRKLTADEIIKKSCGTGLNSQVFVDYLKNKYYDIYEI